MNLLFQALAIFAFIVPGLIFRAAYFQAAWKYPKGRLGSISDEIPRALIAAGCVDFTYFLAVRLARTTWNWLGLSQWFVHIPIIDLKSTVRWLANNFGHEQVEYGRAVRSLTEHPNWVFLYFAGLYLSAWLLGKASQLIVRRTGMDIAFPLFQYDNEWFYIFSGEEDRFPIRRYSYYDRWRWMWGCEIKDVPKPSRGEALIAMSRISAVVGSGDQARLYVGVLESYDFDQSGALDRITLTGAGRRPLGNQSDDPNKKPSFDPTIDYVRFYPIKGRYLVLKMKDVTSLSVEYVDEATIDAILSWKEKRKGPESSASPPGPPTDVGAFKDPPALSLRFKQYSDLFKDAYNATLAAINSKAASQDAPYRELQEFATLLDEDLRGVMTAIERLAESEAPENSGAVLRKFKNDLVILQVLASRLQAPPTDSPDVLIHDTLAVRDFIRRRRAAYAKDERAWRASRGDASEGSD